MSHQKYVALDLNSKDEPGNLIIWSTSEWERPLSPRSGRGRLKSGRMRDTHGLQAMVHQDPVGSTHTESYDTSSQLLPSRSFGPRSSNATYDNLRRPRTAPFRRTGQPEHGAAFITGVDLVTQMPPDRDAGVEAAEQLIQDSEDPPHVLDGFNGTHMAGGTTLQGQDMSLQGPPGSQPTFMTVQYIGIAQGELGVLTKKQLIQATRSPGQPSPSEPPLPPPALQQPHPGQASQSGPGADSRPPTAPDIRHVVDDAEARVRVPSNIFSSKPLRTRPPGYKEGPARSPQQAPYVRSIPIPRSSPGMTTTSRPRVLSAGGFPGWKLSRTAPNLVVKPHIPLQLQQPPRQHTTMSYTAAQQRQLTRGISLAESHAQGTLPSVVYDVTAAAAAASIPTPMQPSLPAPLGQSPAVSPLGSMRERQQRPESHAAAPAPAPGPAPAPAPAPGAAPVGTASSSDPAASSTADTSPDSPTAAAPSSPLGRRVAPCYSMPPPRPDNSALSPRAMAPTITQRSSSVVMRLGSKVGSRSMRAKP